MKVRDRGRQRQVKTMLGNEMMEDERHETDTFKINQETQNLT